MISSPRFLHSLYCDDVRAEIGGKMTFVGVYQYKLVIQHSGAPATLPRLCVVATAQTPNEKPFKSLRFKLVQDGMILQEIPIPANQLQEIVTLAGSDPTCAFQSFGAIITLQPFVIEKNCSLRVHAETEDEELIAGALQIILEKPEANSPSNDE